MKDLSMPKGVARIYTKQGMPFYIHESTLSEFNLEAGQKISNELFRKIGKVEDELILAAKFIENYTVFMGGILKKAKELFSSEEGRKKLEETINKFNSLKNN